MTTRRAFWELIGAGVLWGFGFVGAVWALQIMGPLTLTVWRFALAIAVSIPILLLIPEHRRSLSWAQARLAIIPGLWLCGTLVFQTWGLQYTTATKSSFITTLYILMVPLLERILTRRRLPPMHKYLVLVALVGTYLICDFHGGAWNIGDILTLICAVCASLQIFWFALIAPRIESSFTFNTLQSFWALLIPLALACTFENPVISFNIGLPLLGLCSLAFGSTLIAFMLQIRAQRVLSPSVASLLFLLESPFATLFALWLLHESLKPLQWLGAGLIFLSVLGTWYFDRK